MVEKRVRALIGGVGPLLQVCEIQNTLENMELFMVDAEKL